MTTRMTLLAIALCATGLAAGWGSHVVLSRGSSSTPAASAKPAWPPLSPPSSGAAEAVFDDIYTTAKWGTNGGDAGSSGSGSTLQATFLYRAFLETFMKDVGVRSVVDAGCGDWESTQAIDWTGIDYRGYDIVKAVIDRDTQKFGKPNVQFFHANIVDDELPPADLLICKQVLQHLPNADVTKFLSKLAHYKHVLLIDSVSPGTLSGKNQDIRVGEFRFLDLTRAPFDVKGTKVLTYWDGGSMEQVLHVVPGQ